MKTLVLLRHAKSSWDEPDLADHERPLAPRGLRAAAHIGQFLQARGFHPDLILCSTARRAVETLDLVRAEIGAASVPVERERGLYLCGRLVLLERVRDLPETVGSAMLVAHNPDMHELALFLIGSGDPLALAEVRRKYPTAACAVLEFGDLLWRDIAAGSARLAAFEVPPKKSERDRVREK